MVEASVDGGRPECLPLLIIALEQGPQGTDRIGTRLAPTHPRTLQPLVDHRPARRLDVPRADLPARLDVGRVVHPARVVAEVLRHLRYTSRADPGRPPRSGPPSSARVARPPSCLGAWHRPSD